MSDAGGTTTTTTTTTPNWYDGLDEAHRGHVIARGWHTKSADEAAREAAIAHRASQSEFSRVHGVPADQLLRFPKDAADPGWAELHKRLGVPDSPDAYKIEGLKFADGTEPAAEFVGHMRALAKELNLPADKAQALAARVMALADNDAAEGTREATAARSANDAELRRAWGGNHDFFRFQTTRAAQILGIPDSVVQSMEAGKAEDYLKFMDNLRGLAGKMGEAELLRGEGGGGNKILTREEAIARREDLMKDTAFVQRYINGDAAAKVEMENLARTIVGPAP